MSNLSPRYRRRVVVGRILGSLLALTIITVVMLLVKRAVDVPVVHRTWPDGKCVRVVDDSARSQGREPYTCRTVPERHESFWVDGNRS